MFISVTQYLGCEGQKQVPPHVQVFEDLLSAQAFAHEQSEISVVIQSTVYALGVVAGIEQCTFRDGKYLPDDFWRNPCENSQATESAGELCLSKDQIIYGENDTQF